MPPRDLIRTAGWRVARANARVIDRMIPEDIGGYPVNYGFVPQTVSYDGDPFDVLGPPLPDGRLLRGVIAGVMFMEDEKGLDSKGRAYVAMTHALFQSWQTCANVVHRRKVKSSQLASSRRTRSRSRSI
jgi:inorganic pyrophosphatase